MTNPTTNLKLAEKGALLGIASYLFLSSMKLLIGSLISSSSLVADGWNNATDVLANVAVWVGIRLARRPADFDHRFGHWKMEDLASLVTSFVMFFAGCDLLLNNTEKIIHNEQEVITPWGALMGILSTAILLGVYFFNKQLAKKTQSKALDAVAKDNLSDALISIGTIVAILASSFHLSILDKLAAIFIAFFILQTAYHIFRASSFSLSDGFDEGLLAQYQKAILSISTVHAVKSQRGRTYGSNIYLDVTLEMDPHLSVYESHAVTEQVEQLLKDRFGVFDCDIHVEPALILEKERTSSSLQTWLAYENRVFSQLEPQLLAEGFFMIDEQGNKKTKQDVLQGMRRPVAECSHIDLIAIHPSICLLYYERGGCHHSSLWCDDGRSWRLAFHQITKHQAVL